MDDHEARASLRAVPAYTLVVLEREELVGRVGSDAIGHVVLRKLRHDDLASRFGEVNEVEPAALMTLEGGIGWRRARFVVIRADIHHVPLAELYLVLRKGVVEIGQPQYVAELMTEGSDAVETRAVTASQLAATGVEVDAPAVETEVDPGGRESPRMWPDGVVGGAVVLAVTSIDDEDEINLRPCDGLLR